MVVASCVVSCACACACACAVVRGGGVSRWGLGFRRGSSSPSRGWGGAFRSAAPAAHVPVHDQLALVPADADEVPSVVGEAHDVGVVRDGDVVDLRVGTRERDPRVRFRVDLRGGKRGGRNAGAGWAGREGRATGAVGVGFRPSSRSHRLRGEHALVEPPRTMGGGPRARRRELPRAELVMEVEGGARQRLHRSFPHSPRAPTRAPKLW